MEFGFKTQAHSTTSVDVADGRAAVGHGNELIRVVRQLRRGARRLARRRRVIRRMFVVFQLTATLHRHAISDRCAAAADK